MKSHASQPRARRSSSPVQPRDLSLRLIQIAGGDPAYEASLREMIWHAYCDAGRPLGPTEAGMMDWLAQQQLQGS